MKSANSLRLSFWSAFRKSKGVHLDSSAVMTFSVILLRLPAVKLCQMIYNWIVGLEKREFRPLFIYSCSLHLMVKLSIPTGYRCIGKESRVVIWPTLEYVQ
jgi:hypothetical protein